MAKEKASQTETDAMRFVDNTLSQERKTRASYSNALGITRIFGGPEAKEKPHVYPSNVIDCPLNARKFELIDFENLPEEERPREVIRYWSGRALILPAQ